MDRGVPVRRRFERFFLLKSTDHPPGNLTPEMVSVFLTEESSDLSYVASRGVTSEPSPPVRLTRSTAGSPSGWLTASVEFRFVSDR